MLFFAAISFMYIFLINPSTSLWVTVRLSDLEISGEVCYPITFPTKARNRKIISNEFFEGIIAKMEKTGVKMNNYINTLESKTNNKSV